MTYPLVSELAKAGIRVTVSCRVLKLARQPYYRWRNAPVRDADVLRAYRINALHDAHHDDPTFGYRYLADQARRAGWRMSRHTARKLCSQAGILSCAQRRRRGKGKKAGPPVFDDHVKPVLRAMARELRRHDMVGSMGRAGPAGDNAAMESLWSLLQTNVLNQQRSATRHELRLAIVVWIERKYHRQRAQDTLDGLTPIELEAKLTEPLTLTA
ncbi:hypothetical protein SAMN06309944_1729 [Micrococcales bacterium KH10]|nr:hypothetical protein SAMN06309944_1729 [Micrococcales bacterium KH10]